MIALSIKRVADRVKGRKLKQNVEKQVASGTGDAGGVSFSTAAPEEAFEIVAQGAIHLEELSAMPSGRTLLISHLKSFVKNVAGWNQRYLVVLRDAKTEDGDVLLLMFHDQPQLSQTFKSTDELQFDKLDTAFSVSRGRAAASEEQLTFQKVDETTYKVRSAVSRDRIGIRDTYFLITLQGATKDDDLAKFFDNAVAKTNVSPK